MRKLNKQGQIGSKVTTAITSIILVVVLFLMFAELVPEAQTAGDTLNKTGVPLGSLFSANGVMVLLIMVGLLLTVLKAVLPSSKK